MIPKTEHFQGFILTSCPRKTSGDRWSAAVKVTQSPEGSRSGRFYYADDGTSYILEEEAAEESLNLGRNLIKRGML